MKILLFGKNGQVGWELCRSLAPLGELVALDAHSTEHCGDFLQPELLAKTVADISPDVIVKKQRVKAMLYARLMRRHRLYWRALRTKWAPCSSITQQTTCLTVAGMRRGKKAMPLVP